MVKCNLLLILFLIITGCAQNPAAPKRTPVPFNYITIDQPDINFQEVWIGAEKTSLFGVTNHGVKETNIKVKARYCPDEFTINDFVCHRLEKRGTCQINVTFRPREEGVKTCELVVSNSDEKWLNVKIRGEGRMPRVQTFFRP